MKKSEQQNFHLPMRQSYAAIALIAYRLYKILFRQLLPFLLIFLFGGSTNKKTFLLLSVIGTSVFGFVYSIVAFFKYTFHLTEDKLIVRKGVFRKTNIEIPFDRIQSINYEQNLIHRLFNVVKLNMDTAGSKGSELEINALDHNLARNISEYILSNRGDAVAVTEDSAHHDTSSKDIIFKLNIPQLLKVGITENHLRSGGIIIFFFIWIWENLQDIGLDLMERFEEYAPKAEVITKSAFIIAGLVISFALASMVISLIRTVLRYFNLRMYRKGDGFTIISGLLSRREHTAKDSKIQLLQWSQNLLQELSSIYLLSLKQASSVEVSDSKSLRVAGLQSEDVDQVKSYLFKEQSEEIESITRHGVHSYYRYRMMYFWTLVLLPLTLLSFYFGQERVGIGLCIWYFISILSSYLRHKKKKYGVGRNMLVIEGGTFGSSTIAMELYKLQAVSISRRLFQRRRGLATLSLHSASGELTIPDITMDKCLSLKNYILFKIEKSKESWM